jgi:hypothetical protein
MVGAMHARMSGAVVERRCSENAAAAECRTMAQAQYKATRVSLGASLRRKGDKTKSERRSWDFPSSPLSMPHLLPDKDEAEAVAASGRCAYEMKRADRPASRSPWPPHRRGLPPAAQYRTGKIFWNKNEISERSDDKTKEVRGLPKQQESSEQSHTAMAVRDEIDRPLLHNRHAKLAREANCRPHPRQIERQTHGICVGGATRSVAFR